MNQEARSDEVRLQHKSNQRFIKTKDTKSMGSLPLEARRCNTEHQSQKVWDRAL